jgi:ABC-type transporter MlaC component
MEGISMALTLRQEFSSVLRRKGGVDGLIAILREKTA